MLAEIKNLVLKTTTAKSALQASSSSSSDISSEYKYEVTFDIGSLGLQLRQNQHGIIVEDIQPFGQAAQSEVIGRVSIGLQIRIYLLCVSAAHIHLLPHHFCHFGAI